MHKKASKFSLRILIPIIIIVLVWAIYMFAQNSWYLFTELWFMSVTMVFGSFIAGASAEGGGAVAFPVMNFCIKFHRKLPEISAWPFNLLE